MSVSVHQSRVGYIPVGRKRSRMNANISTPNKECGLNSRRFGFQLSGLGDLLQDLRV